jgi:glycosyltransferase involved in cell wall biosynthesis
MVWDSVDCISYLFSQAARSSQKLRSKLMTRFELPRTRKYEARMAQLFDRTLVTSRLDQEAFAGLLPPDAKQVEVLPNGVDLEYFTPGIESERDPATLVISGKMSYHANVAMVTNLVENIMPHIWAKKPDVKLCVVGKDPPRSITQLSERPGVTVTGYVDDLRPYLQRATIALAPLTYGAGIQNKVLEAMACATPVIATPRATAALSAVVGQDLLIEQDPELYANQVLELLDHPEQARRIGEAGRAFVEKFHGWEAITSQLEAIYAHAVEESL